METETQGKLIELNLVYNYTHDYDTRKNIDN